MIFLNFNTIKSPNSHEILLLKLLNIAVNRPMIHTFHSIKVKANRLFFRYCRCLIEWWNEYGRGNLPTKSIEHMHHFQVKQTGLEANRIKSGNGLQFSKISFHSFHFYLETLRESKRSPSCQNEKNKEEEENDNHNFHSLGFLFHWRVADNKQK